MELDEAVRLATKELERATDLYGPFASPHEGYAVIKEELEELWEEVKNKHATEDELIEEAVQLAAMSLRFIMDCST
jgi:hypothetical protein